MTTAAALWSPAMPSAEARPASAVRAVSPEPVVTPELIEAELAAYRQRQELAAVAAERAMRAQPRSSRHEGLRPFVWPAAGSLTGWFGERRGHRAHLGLDIDGATGDPVVAAGPGVVVHAGGAPTGYAGYGQTVIIDHGEGVVTVYAHLSRVDAVAGERTDAGTRLGAIGTTGSVTGSHLHFEVRVDGVLVDPADWLG